MNEKIWDEDALNLAEEQLKNLENQKTFETRSGKKYTLKEDDDAYICSRRGQHIVILKSWVNGLTWPLSRAGALDVILSAMEHDYYVGAKQPFDRSSPIPVYGDTEEGCKIWMENQIGDWALIRHSPII